MERDSNTYLSILKRYWGYDSFRGVQQEIVESIGSGHDTLGLMPTGGGKSVTFQVPALAMEGVCIVITPLIALMKDQVLNLRRRGIKATAIYSGLSRDEVIVRLENAIFGGVKLLYVSPERLESELFLAKLRHINVSFITVDEAHCICQWGYDFRPAYLNIANIRKLLPHKPVLALTATATPQVVDDIQKQLQFAAPRVFRMSFERKNLTYIVRQTEDKRRELLHILSRVGGSAIVYVRSRQHCKEIAELLNDNGQSATFYHAGLENKDKDERQQAWRDDKTRIMVATNAFGMGIDKPDVRIVIHADCPDSIEAYFQEAGRAGRDGQRAYAVLLYNKGDNVKLNKRIADNYPEKDYIRKVYNSLAYFFQLAVGSGYNKTFEFNLVRFCQVYHFFPIQAEAALRLLTRAGYIEYMEEEESTDRVHFTLGRDELYRLEGNRPEEDKVIVAMLRIYGGLFVDYVIINLDLIGEHTGLKRHEVYIVLKSLNDKHILHFIPSRRTPHIHYTQRREDSAHLHFPRAVYEDRKRQYTKRIQAILAYAEKEGICRSRLLLAYFGERSTKDCGQCDACKAIGKQERKDARQKIMELLADGKQHDISELWSVSMPSPIVDKALAELLDEEDLYYIEGRIGLPKAF